VRKIAATYIFTGNNSPLKNAILLCEEDGTIVEVVEKGNNFTEEAGVEFYSGILVPGFVRLKCNLKDHTLIANRKMWAQGVALAADFENSVYVECEKNALKFQQLFHSGKDTKVIELDPTLEIEFRNLEFNNLVLAEIFMLQQKDIASLPELFERISADAAKCLGMDNRFGSFEKGKQPGVNLITGVDFKHMKLSSRSKVTRLL
jgi:hypothetical protein